MRLPFFFLLTLIAFSTPVLSQDPNVPVILVRGYGPRVAEMVRYQKFLSEEGVRNVHALQYDHTASPGQLRSGALQSLGAIISRYPGGTQFDMITHSFGGFVGLYTAMPSVFANRIRKYVSLASVAHGQNWLPFCSRGWCGQTLPLLIPYLNPFVQDFFRTYQPQVDRLQKCTLYSNQDNIVHEPADSGVFDGGINVEVRNVRHLEFVTSWDVYRIMRTACYGAPPPVGGFLHDWRRK
jgi:hypothetical protein